MTTSLTLRQAKGRRRRKSWLARNWQMIDHMGAGLMLGSLLTMLVWSFMEAQR